MEKEIEKYKDTAPGEFPYSEALGALVVALGPSHHLRRWDDNTQKTDC